MKIEIPDFIPTLRRTEWGNPSGYPEQTLSFHPQFIRAMKTAIQITKSNVDLEEELFNWWTAFDHDGISYDLNMWNDEYGIIHGAVFKDYIVGIPEDEQGENWVLDIDYVRKIWRKA